MSLQQWQRQQTDVCSSYLMPAQASSAWPLTISSTVCCVHLLRALLMQSPPKNLGAPRSQGGRQYAQVWVDNTNHHKQGDRHCCYEQATSSSSFAQARTSTTNPLSQMLPVALSTHLAAAAFLLAVIAAASFGVIEAPSVRVLVTCVLLEAVQVCLTAIGSSDSCS